MTELAFHSIATESLQELESLPVEESAVELVVDTFDELVFLKDALNDIVRNQDDLPDLVTPERVIQAKELRNLILDDVTEMQIESSDRLLPVTYEVDEPQLVVDAVKLHKQITREREATVIHYPEYDWLSDPTSTRKAAEVARAHSTEEFRKLFNQD
jgi:hypothetical protein